jgi:hypothetical protein
MPSVEAVPYRRTLWAGWLSVAGELDLATDPCAVARAARFSGCYAYRLDAWYLASEAVGAFSRCTVDHRRSRRDDEPGFGRGV